jgi:hypothetical protein
VLGEITTGSVSCLVLGFLAGAFFVGCLWAARSKHRRSRHDYSGRGPAHPSTDVAKLVLAAHEAAQELDAAVTVGNSDEIVQRAYRAEQSARWLAAKIKANEDRHKTG